MAREHSEAEADLQRQAFGRPGAPVSWPKLVLVMLLEISAGFEIQIVEDVESIGAHGQAGAFAEPGQAEGFGNRGIDILIVSVRAGNFDPCPGSAAVRRPWPGMRGQACRQAARNRLCPSRLPPGGSWSLRRCLRRVRI